MLNYCDNIVIPQIDSVTGNVTQKQAIPKYPENGRISFVVTATDGGVPPLSGTATVNIDVTPSNEHAPVFSEDQFELELRSDASVGSRVFIFSPKDEDVGGLYLCTFGRLLFLIILRGLL